jgi:hypothetical protein
MDIVSEVVVEEGSQSAGATNPITNPVPEPIGTKPEAAEEKPAVDPAEPVEKPTEDPIPKGVQKRIDRAVRQKYEAEARAKMLEERVAAMEARQAPQQQRQQDDGKPTIDKFDNFDDYVDAKADWKYEQREKERLAKEELQRVEHEQRQVHAGWNKRIAAATAEMPDFEEVLSSSDIPMTKVMEYAIKRSDIGPKLAYYLANNPDEAEQLAEMDTEKVIRTLGRIEERLSNTKPVVQTTNAPPPLKPIGSKAVVTKDPGKMSDAEYAKWRKSYAA